jgi:hypothetical protein
MALHFKWWFPQWKKKRKHGTVNNVGCYTSVPFFCSRWWQRRVREYFSFGTKFLAIFHICQKLRRFSLRAALALHANCCIVHVLTSRHQRTLVNWFVHAYLWCLPCEWILAYWSISNLFILCRITNNTRKDKLHGSAGEFSRTRTSCSSVLKD